MTHLKPCKCSCGKTYATGAEHIFCEEQHSQKAKELLEALEALWPFLEDELGMVVTKNFGMAIKKAADALGKHVYLEDRPSGMFYVREIEA